MSDRLTVGQLAEEGFLFLGDGYRTKVAEYGRPGLPILRVADVTDRGVTVSGTPDFVSLDFRAAMGAKTSQPGDVVLTTKGTVGRVGIIREDDPEFVYSPQLCWFRLTEEAPLLPEYLSYWLRSRDFEMQAAQVQGQTDMADYINLRDLRRLSIPIPSRTEQRNVCDVLGALDDKIECNQRMADVCQELVRITYSRLDPFACSLGDIAVEHKNVALPSSSGNEQVLHFSLPAFDAGHMPELTDSMSILSQKNRLTPGLVLLSRLNPRIPRAWIPDLSDQDVAFASTEFLALRPAEAATSADVWAAVSSPTFQTEMRLRATGTSGSHQRVRPLDALSIPCCNPMALPLEERQLASSLLTRSSAALRESKTLSELRDALLPKLLSGEIRVEEAEEQVEEAV